MNPAFVQSSAAVASHPSSSRSLAALIILFFLAAQGVAQSATLPITQPDSINNYSIDTSQAAPLSLTTSQKKKRIWLIGGLNVAGYGGTLLTLNRAWYKNEPRTRFHTFNDNREWLQMDKAGHIWTAYNTGMAATAMWKWTGMNTKTATWIGGLSGTLFLTGIEYLDAHSAKWGWSWGDIGANLAGSAFFISQELLWQEQRIQFKFSFHKKSYNEQQLEERVNNLFGRSWYERMLKDYNAQTYWASLNLRSFWKESNLPAWLNIAVGYGANGMLGGFENKWEDLSGNAITRYDIARTREFYLSPDIDFTKIKTGSKFLRTTFTFLNAFKCPAPALMLNNKGKFKFYPFYF